MAHGYATANAASGLATTAFTFNSMTASNKGFLNDAAMDGVCSATSSASSRNIVVDLGAATTIYGVALLNHNLASWSAPKVTVKGATDAAITIGVVTTKAQTDIAVAVPNDKDTVLQFNGGTSKRYWQIIFDSGATETLRLGELMLLTGIASLTRSKAYGWGEAEEYAVNSTESRTGNSRRTFLAGPIRTKRLPFIEMAGESQRNELLTMFRATQGGVTNLLWMETIEATSTAATAAGQQCLWGKLQPSLGWRETDFFVYDVDGFELRSVGRDVGR